MKAKQFIEALEDARIAKAIGETESVTSAEIRVFITRRKVTDPSETARKKFARMGMNRTEARNGLLIFVAPVSQRFAIIGDQRIQEQVGDEFWKSLASELEDSFKKEEFTEGIIRVIQHAREVLKECFPRKHDDRNELPDHVERD